MSKRQPKSTGNCDFETGGNLDNDQTSIMRNAQLDLYRLDNPYVGNKRKIVVDIAKEFEKAGLQFNTFADVFSGSCVVGLFFKLLGKKVYSNDILTSSYHNALAFVENTDISLSLDDVNFLCNSDNSDNTDFVRKNYADRFTAKEALFLDNYRTNIEYLTGSAFHPSLTLQRYTSLRKALAFVLIQHHIMNHCYLGGRLNSGQILAKLEHRIEHQRNDGHEMSFKLKDLPKFEGEGCSASNLDCLDFLDSIPEVDLAYIDPPYGQSQSDYAFMYAFCEEYVYGRSIDDLDHLKNSKKFVSKKDFERHFRDVLERASRKSKIIAVSFNDDSWATATDVKRIIGDYKKSVDVINMDYKYKYRKEQSDSTEYLFLAQ